MSMMKKLRLNQGGDTIVEVMIVLAILGFAISICLVTANRSLLNARQAQENAEATKLVQSQVEALRVLAPADIILNPDQNIFVTSTPFCVQINDDNTYEVIRLSDAPAYDASCRLGTDEPIYTLLITYCRGNSSAICAGHTTTNTFVAQATWANVRGKGNDTVTLVYRVHPG